VEFDEGEAQSMLVAGTNSIKGSALIRKKNGSIVSCAGNKVFLIPATKYADYAMNTIYNSNENGINPFVSAKTLTNENAKFMKNTRMTKCDVQGFFNFRNIANNSSFYLKSQILWSDKKGLVEGGDVMQRIDLKSEREAAEIVVSPDEDYVVNNLTTVDNSPNYQPAQATQTTQAPQAAPTIPIVLEPSARGTRSSVQEEPQSTVNPGGYEVQAPSMFVEESQ
jgi:hypothetical protein